MLLVVRLEISGWTFYLLKLQHHLVLLYRFT